MSERLILGHHLKSIQKNYAYLIFHDRIAYVLISNPVVKSKIGIIFLEIHINLDQDIIWLKSEPDEALI